MVESLNNLRRPVVVIAFEGWNDAADAATEVVNHLGTAYGAELAFEIDGDDYFDYQETRPKVVGADGVRELEWPTTRIAVAKLPERDLVLVSGPEPNLRWRAFSATVVSALRSVQPELVVVMGAMLTDTPHRRPLHVWASSDDADLCARYDLVTSDYEGPTGIIGVIADACQRSGMPVVHLWGSVPHYVANPPNPKATLALLTRLEDLLNEPLDQGELRDLSSAWERGVDQLAEDNPEVQEYIAQLEESQDESDLPEASGDSIAAEFQRYLRRRNEG